MSGKSMNVHELQTEIADWADRIIPQRTPLSVICKLLEELSELIASDKMSDPSEVADIAILVLDLCHLQQIDLVAAVQAKMVINRARVWHVSDNGRAQHIETA
jgi:NTP pyrophosphatase (non-canonical NTP hydrolase)